MRGRDAIGWIALAAAAGFARPAAADALGFLEFGFCARMVPAAVARDFGEDSCLAGVDPELFAGIRRRAKGLADGICHGENRFREIRALGEDQLDTDYAAWVTGTIMSLGLAGLTAIPRRSAVDEQSLREAALFATRDARRTERRRPFLRREGLHAPAEIRAFFEETASHYREEHRAVSEEYGRVIGDIEEDSSVFHVGHDQESVIRMLEWEEGAHLALRREEWRALTRLVRAPVACLEGTGRESVSGRRPASTPPAGVSSRADATGEGTSTLAR